jgi:hypothetical protein
MPNSSHFETPKDLKYYFVVVSIYVSIFINSFVFFTDPFEFYIGYLVYLILLPIYFLRYRLSRELVYIFLLLFLAGVFNIIVGNNTLPLFLKVFTGLFLSYVFYYFVLIAYDLDIDTLFKWYLKGAYYASVLGLIQFASFHLGFKPGYDFSWILNKGGVVTGGNFGIRVNSIFAEPTYLASTLSAAFFVSMYNIFRKENYYLTRIQGSIIIVVYILSFSGLGQGGVFITLILLSINFGLIRYVIIAIPIALLIFNFLYANVKDFRERYEGLTSLFSGEQFKLGKTHGSSFILYNNYQVTLKSFQSNFLFGTGIGSHPVSFEKYSLAKTWKTKGFNSNAADANSMFLRLMSETGIFGLLVFGFIIVRGYVARNEYVESNHWLISNSILVMILLNLFRQGHYFLNGFPFFVILYYFNGLSYRLFVETGKTLNELTLIEKNEPEKHEV